MTDHLPMVMEPVPSYVDLIWLFEADPVGHERDELDWRDLWPYASVTFRTTRAGHAVEVDIEPSYETVRLRLRDASGAELLNLDLQGVRSVGVERRQNRELLRVDFPDDSPASTLWLRLKPDVTVVWSYDPAT